MTFLLHVSAYSGHVQGDGYQTKEYRIYLNARPGFYEHLMLKYVRMS